MALGIVIFLFFTTWRQIFLKVWLQYLEKQELQSKLNLWSDEGHI